MTALAHAGHWLPSLAGALPVVGVAVWIAVTTWRDRRRRRRAR
jgi:hypothetical protein